ncbi:ADP-ribosyltransferase [Streptomyces sp. P9(2023)]|uniref:putative T7SS-secreted protein n=1 Tax=Streptomyces sp. P9(2023) TaxID=3064394 RepID=UPI0028F40C9E|nr:ADP-ribosyltransferase [Streptomyces sp. P9(2023)]MDT9688605.1 ADP-ribosyltransferase [Streptomyces sp. P9(2023)]
MGGLLDDIGKGIGDLGKGIEDGINEGLGAIEDGIDSGKKALGEGVDWATDKAGERLDSYGLHGAADVVTDWGDGVASDLGATPGEQQLGQTEEANELVHGNPAKILESAGHLKDFRAAFEKVGQGMRKVDSSRWKGVGGDSFREKFGVHPTKWLHAADACETAAAALEAYADTVRWAQGQAHDAIDLYRKGKQASEQAKAAATEKEAGAAEKAGAAEAETAAKALMEEARARLAQAREQRNTAAADAQGRVDKALAHAPAEPPPLERLGDNIADGYQAYQMAQVHVLGGVLKGTAGLVNFARGLIPFDPYNLTHPAAYAQNVSMTLSGLVSTVSHPDRVVTAAVEGFKKDPAEFIGRLIPELFGTKGTGFAGGGLRAAAREGLEAGATNAASRAVKYGDDVPPPPPHPPTGLADEAVSPAPTVGAADSAASHLPPGWTIDNPAAHPTPTGFLDDTSVAPNWDDLAQPTHLVDEGAVHADSVDPKTAQEFLDDQYPELKGVNEGPGTADAGVDRSPTVSTEEFKNLSVEQKHEVAAAEINDGAVTFPDNNAAIAYGRENWNDYAENLPESTRKSVLDYTDEHGGKPDPRYATYTEMNGYLRGNPELGTPDVLRNIEEVDKALAGRPLPEDVTVARGQGVGHLGVKEPEELVGKTLSDPGYMSTSLGRAAFDDKPGILHLRVPEGTDALWVEKVSHFAGERELLLGRGMNYKVTRAFTDDNGQWHIYGEILPRN